MFIIYKFICCLCMLISTIVFVSTLSEHHNDLICETCFQAQSPLFTLGIALLVLITGGVLLFIGTVHHKRRQKNRVHSCHTKKSHLG